MQANEAWRAPKLVKGNLYEMRLADIKGHRYTFSRARSADQTTQVSGLHVSGCLTFDEFPDYSQEAVCYLSSETPADQQGGLGWVMDIHKHPWIGVVSEDQQLLRLIDELRRECGLLFELTGRAYNQRQLEIMDFGYEHAI